jgi:hypothetical protein
MYVGSKWDVHEEKYIHKATNKIWMGFQDHCFMCLGEGKSDEDMYIKICLGCKNTKNGMLQAFIQMA